jgi:hypothetical protein
MKKSLQFFCRSNPKRIADNLHSVETEESCTTYNMLKVQQITHITLLVPHVKRGNIYCHMVINSLVLYMFMIYGCKGIPMFISVEVFI